MPPSPTQVNVLTTFFESMLYGVYGVLIVVVLYIWATSRRLPLTHKGLFAVSILMFLLATVHMVIVVATHYTGKDPINTVQASIVAADLLGLFGDSVLIWRVWVVWNRNNLVVILPILATLAAFVVGTISAAVITTSTSLNRLLPVPTGVLALVNTALCTSLIAGRLIFLEWRMNRLLRSTMSSQSSYRKISLLVAESGAVLVAANITSLVLEKLKSPGLHVVLNLIAPLLGIVPTLIIVLSHMDVVLGNHVNQRYTESLTVSRFEARVPGKSQTTGTDTSIPTIDSRGRGPIAINVARSVGDGSIELRDQKDTESGLHYSALDDSALSVARLGH